MIASSRKFLVFSLQSSLYALDLTQVAEVSDRPQLWPIPLAPPCYSGALNFHGDIVAVINLHLFLGLPGGSQPEKIIVLDQNIASLAFLVDRVVGIVSEDEVSFSPAPDNGFAAATLTLAYGRTTLLDLEALVLEAETGLKKN